MVKLKDFYLVCIEILKHFSDAIMLNLFLSMNKIYFILNKMMASIIRAIFSLQDYLIFLKSALSARFKSPLFNTIF
jgi:hypothetical protein